MTATAQPARPAYSDEVAAAVRAELARAQVRQVPVARAIGVSQGAVSARLRGAVPWSIEELAIVAEMLDVRLATLLPRSTDPTTSERAAAGMGPAYVRPPGLEPGTQWFSVGAGQGAGTGAAVVDLGAYRAARLAVTA